MTVEIFRERIHDHMYGSTPERYDEITVDELIDLHCRTSTRQAVDLLISFVKFQISLDPDRFVEYITRLADEHDYKVDLSPSV